MPIHEFKCPAGHVTEKVFLTFGAVEQLPKMVFFESYEQYADDNYRVLTPYIECEHTLEEIGQPDNVCGLEAKMIDSVPLPAHFLGNPDGYFRPSPTKRHSYKHINSYGNGDKPK